jgi:hypothetical protein
MDLANESFEDPGEQAQNERQQDSQEAQDARCGLKLAVKRE